MTQTDTQPVDAPAHLLDDWISRDALARELSVTPDTLGRWEARREGPPCTRIGRKILYTHADAEVIAATVAGMPDSLGGKRMAIRVVELARAGLTPDWMPGAVPRCVPVEMKRNRHGDRAVTEVVGTERVRVLGKWRTVEVRACPVRFSPDPQQIEAARCAYDDWRQALGWIREGLIDGGMLREMKVTADMPKVKPWEDR